MILRRFFSVVVLIAVLLSCCAAPLMNTMKASVRDDIATGPLVADEYPVPTHIDFKAHPAFWVDYQMDPLNVTATVAAMRMAALNGASELTVVIDSPGGRVDAGLYLASAFTDLHYHGVKVDCIVSGLAASMGWYLLQTCSVRAAVSTAALLAHEPFSANPNPANYDDLMQRAEDLRVTLDELSNIGSLRLNISKHQFRDRIAHGDWKMTPDDALKLGAIDMIVTAEDVPAKKEPPDIMKTMQEYLNAHPEVLKKYLESSE